MLFEVIVMVCQNFNVKVPWKETSRGTFVIVEKVYFGKCCNMSGA
jgi:hypothetical protein